MGNACEDAMRQSILPVIVWTQTGPYRMTTYFKNHGLLVACLVSGTILHAVGRFRWRKLPLVMALSPAETHFRLMSLKEVFYRMINYLLSVHRCIPC